VTINLDALFESYREEYGGGTLPVDPIELEGLRVFAADALAAAARNRLATSTALDWVKMCVSSDVRLGQSLSENPALVEVPLERPIFIVAAGRTGSTLLQRLLALDSEVRTPQLWELWHPFPARDAEEHARNLDATVELLKLWPPSALRLHPMDVRDPEECHWIMRHNALRATFQLAWGYWEWLQALDNVALRRLLIGYRRQVQVLQTAHGGRRWLSKTFAHMHYWPVLLDVFPDAHIVRIHRDPRASLASACSLIQQLVRGGDPLAVGEIVTGVLDDGLRRMMAADTRLPSDQVTDILYEDLCADPSESVFRLGRRLGLASPDELRLRVNRYLAGPARIRAERHAYALDEFGLSSRGISEQFEGYIDWVRARLDPRFAT
jgi:hypothetical protein